MYIRNFYVSLHCQKDKNTSLIISPPETRKSVFMKIADCYIVKFNNEDCSKCWFADEVFSSKFQAANYVLGLLIDDSVDFDSWSVVKLTTFVPVNA